ncbi:hypothetical protein M9H77_17464 [Catharanthus roseus]|uniref:Uncharacterized protein n=1 Tax=Catharanthus roseus TaxID=4058 RepID=A0ACC0B4P4_CATRO|nr:hypothetical protein M9H77_17464 [Catharanthus roseus]
MSKRRFDCRPYVTIGCERGEGRKKKVRLDDNGEDEEEEVPVKHRDGRHNHKIGVYFHAHAQDARLTDDRLKLTEELNRCQVAPRNVMASLLEKNLDCAVSKQIRAKMKKRMEGHNTVEEVLYQ